MRGGALLVVAVFAVELAGGRALAEPHRLERALQLFEDGKLSQALSELERALKSGAHQGAELATIYLHLGILRAGAGDDPGAEEAFFGLCTLRPSEPVPSGASPVVTAPFERASRRCEASRLGRSEPPLRAPEPPLRAPEGPSAAKSGAAPAPTVALPVPPAEVRSTPRRSSARARPTPAPPAAIDPIAPPPPRDDRSLLAEPWFWGLGAAVISAGVVAAAIAASQGGGAAHIGRIEVVDR
ncbi:MAG: hypothetical protein IT384_23735 [Deltaproteobacteria bacterium]|nr:hypothetical protein [Deltaproteobacteria bacterium]